VGGGGGMGWGWWVGAGAALQLGWRLEGLWEQKLFLVAPIYVYNGVNVSVTISIRVDDAVKEEIESFGHNPSSYIKGILMRELKREHSRKALSWIREHQIEYSGETAEESIREDRDSG